MRILKWTFGEVTRIETREMRILKWTFGEVTRIETREMRILKWTFGEVTRIETREMRILKWIYEVTIGDKVRNLPTRGATRMTQMSKKITEKILKWHGMWWRGKISTRWTLYWLQSWQAEEWDGDQRYDGRTQTRYEKRVSECRWNHWHGDVEKETSNRTDDPREVRGG